MPKTSIDLIDDIINNPDSLKDVSKEKLMELRKQINPYGVVLSKKKSWINISLTNIRDMYLRRIHMMSLAGFLYRSFDDYTFELTDAQIKELTDIKDIKEKHKKEEEFKKVFEEEKEIAKKFINRQFKFNPEKHIKAAASLKKRLSGKPSKGEEAPSEKSASLEKKPSKKSSSANSKIEHIDIPADAFYHWDRYLTNNYEEIVDLVDEVYKERPDIEYAIQYIDHFETEEEAEEHRRMNANSFITPIFTITNNAWTLLGPFKENREKIEFYNKNTDVLKEMIKQMEDDAKLGQEIMEKRRVINKQESVALEGPDDKGLAEYSAALGTIEAIGTKNDLSTEEKRELEQAKKIKDDTEIPKDALGVDMFYTDPKDGEFKRQRFHTDVIEPIAAKKK